MNVFKLVNEAKKVCPDFDIILDPYDLTIVWADPKSLSKIGWTPKDLVGKQAFKFTTLNHTKVLEIAVKFLHGVFWRPVTLICKDGSHIKCKIKTCKINFDGQLYLCKKFIPVKKLV